MATPFQGILEELKVRHQGPVVLLTKNIPHSSGRDFCTALAPMSLRQNLVHCKQLQHAHAELPGADRE